MDVQRQLSADNRGDEKMKNKHILRRQTVWGRILRTLYSWRNYWVDWPTMSLLALYHWHFYSHGVHPVPEDMPETCWAILGMYLLVKEGVRWCLHDIQSRRGKIFVALWMASLMEFFIGVAWWPRYFTMPPKMIETTLIVLGGFLGVLPIKRQFEKKFPKIGEFLEPREEPSKS